ncbi:hypothetical protein ACQKWADRAFT_322719 [Trichoderma austrokoningii]
MAEQMSTPRITAAYLHSFIGRTVTIVGKVTQLRGEQATIDADGAVTILLSRDSHLANGNAAQIIGKVNSDLSIKALNTRDVGAGVGHGVSPLRTHEHQPHIAMVWPAPKSSEPSTVVDSPSSSPAPHRRLSIGRLHRTASPSPPPPPNRSLDFSPSSSSQQDWQHQRQQQWPDPIPHDPPTPSPPSPLSEQHQYESFSSSSSSMPSTALPPDYYPMPGSFHSDFPSSSEEDMFRLAHGGAAASPFTSPRTSPFEPREELQIQPFTVAPEDMSTMSTQAASYSLPSPPTSQFERPESPSSVADSQHTLRQGDSRVLSPPMSPIPRPLPRNSGSGSRYARNTEDVEARALNAVVDGIGIMHVNMSLEAGRWRIARQPGAPW